MQAWKSCRPFTPISNFLQSTIWRRQGKRAHEKVEYYLIWGEWTGTRVLLDKENDVFQEEIIATA